MVAVVFRAYERPSQQYHPSKTWGGWSWRRIMTKRWWFRIWGRRGSGGHKCHGSWGGRGQMYGYPACFIRPRSKPSWYMGWRRWSWRPIWYRPSMTSTKVWPISWQGNIHIIEPTGVNYTHPLRRICSRTVWILSRLKSLAIITQLPNKLKIEQYWSCVWS